MLSSRKVGPAWAAVILSVGLAGCGGRPNVVPVSGTLTYKGKAVTNALLTFEPEHERQSWAETDAQGRFKIHYDRSQDGAAVGTHKVFIEFRPTTDAENEAMIDGKPPPLSADLKAFFSKYSPTRSKLKVEISRATKDLKLDLD
jgi:hypothetical protein